MSGLVTRFTAWAQLVYLSYWEWKLMKASCRLDIHFLDDRRPMLDGGCWCEWRKAHRGSRAFPMWD
jgi:hypothetical protein